MTDSVLTETHGRVGLIRFNRPEAMNALNADVVAALAAAIDDFEANPDIGCLVLTGSDTVFAAGADKAKVRDALEATKGYVGASGKVNMSPTDHMGLDLSAFRLLEVKSGDWTLVGSK